MSNSDLLKMAFRGLVTNPNELAITGDGAMRAFVNGVLTRPQLAQKRRGTKWNATNTTPINKFFNYDGSLLFHCGAGTLKTLADGTITALPGAVNVTPPSGRLRSCIAGKNLYLAGTVPWRVSGAASTPVAAGGLYAPGFDPVFTRFINGAASAVVVPDGKVIAYRYVFGLTDAKENLHLGEVSGRLVVANATGSTQDVVLRAIVPSTATTSHFIQFYRSAAADATPDDDLQLCFERQLTADDISAGYVELTDITPEQLRGAYIYTAPNAAEGIGQNNRAPPGCLEVCAHAGRVLYGNTTQPAEFLFRILAVAGSEGIQDGDVLRFAGLSSPFSMTAVRDFPAILTRVANVVSVVTTGNHGYSTGDYVMVHTGSDIFGIGPFQITVTGATGFTYAEVAADAVLADQAVTRVAAGGPTAGTYVVRTAGTTSKNLEETALNLVAAINKYASNTGVWAQYVSGPFDVPGEILIRGRTAAVTSFVVNAGAGSKRDCFSPQLLPVAHTVNLVRTLGTTVTATVTSGTQSFKVGDQILISPGGTGSGGSVFGAGPFTIAGVGSTNFVYFESGTNGTLNAQTATITPQDVGESTVEQKPNRIYFSKPGEFEAVPRASWIDVGSAEFGIKAMLSQRGQVWVWKEEGVFRVVGTDAESFDWEAVDPKCPLRATESVVLFRNRCWGLTERGVCAVSETGIEVMSAAIADDLQRAWQTVKNDAAALETAGYGTISFELDAFGCAYESDANYILHIPSEFALDGNPSLDAAGKYGGCQLAYVYNVDSGGWSMWDWGLNAITGTANAKRCAIVSTLDDKLYIGDGFNGTGADAYIFRERKLLYATGSSSDYRDTTARHETYELAGTNGSTTVQARTTSGNPSTFEVGDQLLLSNPTSDFPAGPFVVTSVGVPNNTYFTYQNSKPAVGNPSATNRVFFQERGVSATWAWVLQTQAAPDREKRWDELKFVFAQREQYFPTNRLNSQVDFNLALANETASVAAFSVPSQGGQVSRVWPDSDVARGTRLLVTITHSTIDEAFDLAGIGVKAEVLNGASTR